MFDKQRNETNVNAQEADNNITADHRCLNWYLNHNPVLPVEFKPCLAIRKPSCKDVKAMWGGFNDINDVCEAQRKLCWTYVAFQNIYSSVGCTQIVSLVVQSCKKIWEKVD